MDWKGILASPLMIYCGYVMYKQAFEFNTQRKRIQDMPTSTCRAVAMGPVEINGTIIPTTTLTAPFSQKKCVHYAFTVRVRYSRNKWVNDVTAQSGERRVPFYVTDGTGKVLVDPDGAVIEQPTHADERIFTYVALPPGVNAILKNHGLHIDTSDPAYLDTVFTEFCLETGTKAFIRGYAGRNTSTKTGTAKKSEDAVLLQRARGVDFVISDKGEMDVLAALRKSMIRGWVFGGVLLSLYLWLLIDSFLS